MAGKKRFLFYLAGNLSKASSRVRGFWVAEELEKNGVHCSLRWKQSKLDLLKFALEITRHDVVIFQKTYSRYHRWLMAFGNLLGKQTYIDIDDAPSRINSPATLRNVEAMMRMASGVFVGSKNLLGYASKHQSKSYLISSGIKLDNYPVILQNTSKDASKAKLEKKKNKKICLGWIGNGPHYKKDLIQILPQPLKELSKKYDLSFRLIGACGDKELHDVFEPIDGLDVAIIDSIDWSDPSCVADELQKIDIGLYPLLTNDFNQYKCGFKALEYMAMGLPVVASDSQGMRDYVDEGKNGLLASTSNDWLCSIDDLLTNKNNRAEMGRNGRVIVEDLFNTEKIAKEIIRII